MSEELPAWGKVQKRTFTRWCNVHLASRKLKVEDLASDFEDGLKLLNLLEVISGQKIPFNKNVKFYSQKLENVGKAFKFLRDEGLKLVAIGPEDIVEKRIKLILGLVWTIILRYQINKVDYVHEEPAPTLEVGVTTSAAPAASQPKKQPASDSDLLKWVNNAIPEFRIKNFKSDWKDGKALYALTNYLKPGIVDMSASDSLSPLERASKASEAATFQLSIPAILEPTDLVSDHVDDLSTMTYVSLFRDYDRKSRKVDPAHCTVDFNNNNNNKQPIAEIGEDNVFVIRANNVHGDSVRRGGDTFDVKISPVDDPNATYKVDVKDNGDGTYTVHYSPTQAGEVKIEISYKLKPIGKTPYIVTAEKVVKVDPAHTSVVSGPKLEDDGRTHFVVATRDKEGNPIKEGGADFKVAVANVADGTSAHVTVQDLGDGTYDVSVAPPKAAEYEVKIGLKNLNPENLVNGGPFVVKLAPPAEKPKGVDPKDIAVDLSHLLGHGPTKPDDDGYVTFFVKAKNPDAPLSATNLDIPIKGPDGEVYHARITPSEKDGGFLVQFKPTESGVYDIGVTLVDPTGKKEEVPGGPFHVDVFVPATKVSADVERIADNALVDAGALNNAVPDEEGFVYFNVDIPEELPEGAFLEPKITFESEALAAEPNPTDNKKTVSVKFRPEKSGEYDVDADFVDKNGFKAKVKGAPFKVNVKVPPPAPKPSEAAVKAAGATKVHLEPLNAGPDQEDNFGFALTPVDLPEGAKYVAKVTYLPEKLELPAAIKPKPDGDLGVFFKPIKSGEYLLEGFVQDQNGTKTPIAGTPVKLNLTLPERAPADAAVQQAAQDSTVDFSGLSAEARPDGAVSFTVGAKGSKLPEGAVYDPLIIFANENSVIDSKVEDNGDGTFNVVFYPKHEEGPAEYKVSLNLLDKNKNPAKVRGGPWRVIVDIVTGGDADVEIPVRKAANHATVDMSPMNDGPNADGNFHFDVINLPKELPEGAHLESKITLTADSSDVPTTLVPSEKGYSVFFKPTGTGVYLIEVVLVDSKEMGASIKGTPIRLTLNMGTPAVLSADAPDPAVAKAADASSISLSKLGAGLTPDGKLEFEVNTRDLPEGTLLDAKVIYVPEELDLPTDLTPLEDGKFNAAFKPARSGEYVIHANLVDKNGKTARVKGTPAKLMLTLPEPATPRDSVATPRDAVSALKNSGGVASPRPRSGSSAGAPSKDVGKTPHNTPRDDNDNNNNSTTNNNATNNNAAPRDTVAAAAGAPLGSARKAAAPTGPPDAAVSKAAESSSLNLQKLSEGLTPEGYLQFEVNTSDDIPEGAWMDANIIYIPEDKELPSKVEPLEKGKHNVAFKPKGSGEYKLNADLVDKNGNRTKVKGTPVKLSLTLPDPPPSSDTSEHSSGSTSGASQVGDDETDEEHTIMWTHSFVIEAHTKKGTPRIKGGDKFEVAISGPKGVVPGVQVQDLGNGKYQVTYTLPGHGEYKVKATVNGRDIVGSPFTQKI